jgi:hypothetical protein
MQRIGSRQSWEKGRAVSEGKREREREKGDGLVEKNRLTILEL